MNWLVEKMEFLIDKCDDLSRSQKRFMKLWNHFVMERKIYSDKQLSILCLQFSEINREIFNFRPMKVAFIIHLLNLWDSQFLRLQ